MTTNIWTTPANLGPLITGRNLHREVENAQDAYSRMVEQVRRESIFSIPPEYARRYGNSKPAPRRHILKNVPVPKCSLEDFLTSLSKSGLTGYMWSDVRVFASLHEMFVLPTSKRGEVVLSDEFGRRTHANALGAFHVTSVIWYREGGVYRIGIHASLSALGMYYQYSTNRRTRPGAFTTRAFFGLSSIEKLIRVRPKSVNLERSLLDAGKEKRERLERLKVGLGWGVRGSNRWR